MIEKLIFAGFGGQGVLTLGQIVALVGMKNGKEVTWMPSYGPEMRGGTANCSVVISDTQIGSPIVASDISILVAMNKPSLDKFIDKVKDGGTVIINSSMIEDEISNKNLNVIKVNATKIAIELGNQKVQNMVMLGAFLKAFPDFSFDDAKTVINEKFTGKKAEILSLNLEAVKRGMEYSPQTSF